MTVKILAFFYADFNINQGKASFIYKNIRQDRQQQKPALY